MRHKHILVSTIHAEELRGSAKDAVEMLLDHLSQIPQVFRGAAEFEVEGGDIQLTYTRPLTAAELRNERETIDAARIARIDELKKELAGLVKGGAR